MAESRADRDGYVLVENHCPICVAAKTCQGYCRAELDTFRAVLGPDATVERTEHIVQGDRKRTSEPLRRPGPPLNGRTSARRNRPGFRFRPEPSDPRVSANIGNIRPILGRPRSPLPKACIVIEADEPILGRSVLPLKDER